MGPICRIRVVVFVMVIFVGVELVIVEHFMAFFQKSVFLRNHSQVC